MKNRTIYTALLLAALVTGATLTAIAQEGIHRKVTLNEAIELSLKNSKQLKLGQAKTDEAHAALREARERRLPDLKTSASYMRLNSPDVDLKLPTSSQQASEGGANNSQTVKVDQAMFGMSTLSVPVFSGFRINYGIESARYLEQATLLDAEKDKDEVVLNVLSAYSNLYKAAAAVELMEENLKSAQQRAKELTNLEQNGLLARNDLLKAELQTSNIELALEDAKNNYRVAMLHMNLMLGLDRSTVLKIDNNTFNELTLGAMDRNFVAYALANRKDIAALEMREKAAATGVKAVKGEYYPNLAVTGGYVAVHVPHLLTVTNALNAGIGLQYNFGALWKTGARVQEAKARVQQMRATKEMLQDAITLQVEQASINCLSARKKISVYEKAIAQSEENYRIVKNKYDNNLATTTELLDADIAQLQARLNYSNAKADAVVLYNKLLQVSGLLNEQTN